MNTNTYNHIITAKVARYDKTGTLQMVDVEDLDVAFNDDGEILEIKVFSEHFYDWITVPVETLRREWPGKFEAIENTILQVIKVDLKQSKDEFRFFDLAGNR